MRFRSGAYIFLAVCFGALLAPGKPAPREGLGPLSNAYLSNATGSGQDEERGPLVPSFFPTAVQTRVFIQVPQAVTLEGLKIEILNGSGAPKVALKLSVALDRRKIRTLRVDNADRWNYSGTQLRCRPQGLPRALALAELLGLEPASVSADFPVPQDADVAVILGLDHEQVLQEASRRDQP